MPLNILERTHHVGRIDDLPRVISQGVLDVHHTLICDFHARHASTGKILTARAVSVPCALDRIAVIGDKPGEVLGACGPLLASCAVLCGKRGGVAFE
ncbi:hypothetical protein FA889_01795 [Treponema pallidum]|nr:hypothetical protein FFV11_01795 [Treponema pallidum subsp. pallidum]QFP69242.1 hypothetical protein FA889_01795 [Treponema pallidum]QFP74288.1 hypothetical protein FA890_01795 [Treponema pallidum]